MKRITFVALFSLVVFLGGCAGTQMPGQVGVETKGLIGQDGNTTYLFDIDGNRRYRVVSNGNFELPVDQCAEVHGVADQGTNPPTLRVTSYETMECR